MNIGKLLGKFKAKEASFNDERLKLVNDMINGIRTIKCYGWEYHYLEKLKQARKNQFRQIFLYTSGMNIGYTIILNLGLVALLIIFVAMYHDREDFTKPRVFSLMAILFYIFNNNGIMGVAVGVIQTFFTILKRISEIL